MNVLPSAQDWRAVLLAPIAGEAIACWRHPQCERRPQCGDGALTASSRKWQRRLLHNAGAAVCCKRPRPSGASALAIVRAVAAVVAIAVIAVMVFSPMVALHPAAMVPVLAAFAAVVGLLDRRTPGRRDPVRIVDWTRREGRCAKCSETQQSCGGGEGYHGSAHGVILLFVQ